MLDPITITLGGEHYRVQGVVSKYLVAATGHLMKAGDNPIPALFFRDVDTEELVCMASVNVMAEPPEGAIWIKDYSENAGLVVQLIEYGWIAERTEKVVWHTGWTTVESYDMAGPLLEAWQSFVSTGEPVSR